ncbi:right-handed parallel beta-helix repeat-containing protein [Streptomyces sp. NBC_00190]|uniref:right-handed parallel beta-helix repeat-containing protein n=1 Tax=Streptomyces sp. NBC_00190 TaxID=2903634 RepID=UPI002E27BFA7|nr:right-handed parallel beta-helix repeat-containing protein [Streptomyces sp. NBC_00190]
MRLSISRTAPIFMGLTLAAFGVVTPPATAQADTPGPDLLGVSQPAAAPASPMLGIPSAEEGRTTRAAGRALIVNVTSCSESDLQAAIGAVATVGGTVNLRPGCTYTLADATPPNDDNGLPVITSNVTINGVGDTITRAVTAANFRFFEIDGPNGNLTLNALTLSNGHASSSLGNGRGGAIWLNGAGPALTLNSTRLTANIADTFGGAVDNDNGTVSVNWSTLSNNTAGAGGAVFVSPFGGSGTATVNGSRITGNHATSLAGGIAAAVGTAVTLNSTPVTGNDVTGNNAQGGGIAQAGTLKLNGSLVTGNTTTGNNAQGGGVFNISGAVQLTSSPVTGNTANGTNSRGGGIFNTSSGTVALTSSPVTNNRALGTGADGGGIFNASGTVTRVASLVAGNQPNNCGSPSTVPGCV